MNCRDVKVGRISRTIASAIAVMLVVTALAQDSPRHRMPRRAFEGKIDIRNATIPDAAAAADPNTAQGPGPDRLARGRVATYFQLRRRLAQL